MLNKVDELSLMAKFDPDYILSLFHSINIEKNLKIASIVSQYDSVMDFFSIFTKAKTIKLHKTLERSFKSINKFLTDLTSPQKSSNHITHYLTVLSRVFMFKYIITQINSITDIITQSGQEYVTTMFDQENDEEIKGLLSQFTIFLANNKEKKRRSRASTKTNTGKQIDDDIKNIPTPKFIGKGSGEESNFSFDDEANRNEKKIVLLTDDKKKENALLIGLNTPNKTDSKIKQTKKDYSKSATVVQSSSHKIKHRLFDFSLNKVPCVEILKIINEMSQWNMISMIEKTFLKEKFVAKDKKLMSLFRKAESIKELYDSIHKFLDKYQ